MRNNQNNWAKTIAVSYKYLEKMSSSIDKLIDKIACDSVNVSSKWIDVNSIQNVSKRIIDLSHRKINYINIKVLVEKILQSINKGFAKIIILRYIHNLKCDEVASLLGLNARTFYRKLEKAIDAFSSKMFEFGFSEPKMEMLYLNDPLLGSLYKEIESEGKSLIKNSSISEHLGNDYFIFKDLDLRFNVVI